MRHRSAQIFELRNVALFSACTDKELELIARSTTRLCFDAGTVMAREDHQGNEFVAIVEGRARVEKRGQLLATLREGDFFGEIALLDGGPRTASVIAETDVVAEVIGRREFAGLVETAPHMAKRLLVGLASRLRAADFRLVA
jgi:CRP-like cAMP-binding protein